MRILYDHQVFSLQDTGGASRYHYELIRNLQAAADTDIELLLGLNASVMPFPELRTDRARITSWRSRIKPGIARYTLNELISSLIAPTRGQFDIYHPTLYRSMPLVRGRRLVVTHHDCIHERFPQLFRNAASIIRSKRKLFSQADAIICVSDSSRRDLLQFYDIAEEKTHVIHHGFSPLQVSPGTGEGGNVSDSPYLLYVGSRAGYKNFLLLLEAFSQSRLARDYRFIIAGGGPFSLEENSRIAQLGLSESVVLIPRTSDAGLATLYRNASLFVYPSLYEGFGFPPLEAMSLGCPVLVNRTSSLLEVCGNAAFYFRSGNPEDLSCALVSSLADAEGLSTRRKLGYEQVRLYDWAKTARSTVRVYESC